MEGDHLVYGNVVRFGRNMVEELEIETYSYLIYGAVAQLLKQSNAPDFVEYRPIFILHEKQKKCREGPARQEKEEFKSWQA